MEFKIDDTLSIKKIIFYFTNTFILEYDSDIIIYTRKTNNTYERKQLIVCRYSLCTFLLEKNL